MSADLEDLRARWERWEASAVAWDKNLHPPVSPSTEDIAHLLDPLREHERRGLLRSVGLLGCTPQVRAAILASFPAVLLYLVDFSLAMYQATTDLAGRDAPEREFLIHDEWLSSRSWPGSPFSAMVGDRALDHLALPEWPEFFRRMHGRLSDGAPLVLHVTFLDESLQGRPFKQLHDTWAQRLRRGETDLDGAACGLFEDLLSAGAEGSLYVTLAPYWDDLLRHGSPPSSDPLSARMVELFRRSRNETWTNFKFSHISEASNSYFEIVDLRTSHDYFGSERQPTIIFRRL